MPWAMGAASFPGILSQGCRAREKAPRCQHQLSHVDNIYVHRSRQDGEMVWNMQKVPRVVFAGYSLKGRYESLRSAAQLGYELPRH